MKQLLLAFTFIAINLAGYAQKDKTKGWTASPSISGNITVTVNDVPAGKNHYRIFSIKPYAAKMMKFRLHMLDGNYIVKISSKTKTFVDTRGKGASYFIFSLPDTDSLNVMLVGVPTEQKPVTFTYSYSISDTAKIPFQIKSPQETFEQLLFLAVNKFENRQLSNANGSGDTEYKNGLFFNARAVCENGYVTQLTGLAQTAAAAEKDNAEWNKKIKAWLKDYKVTEVKKLNREQLQAKSNYLFNESTEYIKRNAAGDILFVVDVYKTEDSEGFYTGVYISNR